MTGRARNNSRSTEPRVAQQKAAFEFLREKYNTQELFTREQFQAATGFGDVSFDTYMSKHFRDLLVKVTDNNLRVSLAFRQYATWRKFRDNVVTQNRILTRQYERSSYENVVMFEFFMPLRNEESLRAALDGLFYKDSIKFRLKTINASDLKKRFAPQMIETAEWTTATQLARYWQLVNAKGEPTTAAIMKWTKRSENEHPLPYCCMGDLLRFKREEVDRWAQEEAARRRSESNRRKLHLAS